MSVKLGLLVFELSRKDKSSGIRLQPRELAVVDDDWHSGIRREAPEIISISLVPACLDCSTILRARDAATKAKCHHRTSAHTALSTISSVAMSLAFVERPMRGTDTSHSCLKCYAPYDCQYKPSYPH